MPLVITRFAAAAIVWLAVTPNGTIALADAAAGRMAFEKGDYVRAMAEWATAAQNNDRDAEFGLGNLYERGDGELQQSYKKAEEWYQKAAERGHIGALYRLALIRAAGSDDLPANLIEAYKWILLASEKGIALDVKAQLEQVTDREQQAEARQRATSWKEAHAAKAAEPPAAAATLSGPTASPAARATAAPGGKSRGCPGWPFPTLPCTEQFPALPGASPHVPRRFRHPGPRQRIDGARWGRQDVGLFTHRSVTAPIGWLP